MVRNIKGIYILCSCVLILPVLICTLFSGLFAGSHPEDYDRQVEAIILECKDVTDRSKGEYENGGPSLAYEVTAQYVVDGKNYQIVTTDSKKYKTGSSVIIFCNSEKPEKFYWSAEPQAEHRRSQIMHYISAFLLLLTSVGCLMGIESRKLKRKQNKEIHI